MTKKKKATRPNKRLLWFKYFTDESNPTTFLNKTASAKAAQYKCSTDESFRAVGYENFTKLHSKIEKWIEDFGLSDNQLKTKLLSLLDAKQTKFFQKDGVVTETRTVEALEIQRKTLDMILKVKGLYGPEKHEHAGKDGGPIETKNVKEMTNEELLKIASGAYMEDSG